MAKLYLKIANKCIKYHLPEQLMRQRAGIRSVALAGIQVGSDVNEGQLTLKKISAGVVFTKNIIMPSMAVEVDGDELEPLASGAFIYV
jgi:hypothetical protein